MELTFFKNSDAIETELLFGKGRAYGIEWLLKKKAGKFTGWIAYTLSKTEKRSMVSIAINGTMQDRTARMR